MRVLVVDDERLARVRLIRMLERIAGALVVGEAENGERALVLIAKLRPDVVLLDVQMPGLDGLALARMPGLPPILFVTAQVQRLPDEATALIKPVRQARLEQALRGSRSFDPDSRCRRKEPRGKTDCGYVAPGTGTGG